MDKTWKAGDTCQIKPSRKHSVLKAKCARLWTVYDVSCDDALVHDGPAGMTDLRGPGWTCSARVPLDCLLPPVDARPTVAAEAGTEVLQLRARVAELEDAQRWRVTAEDMPPVGVEVLGWYGDGCQIVSRSTAKPSRWLAQDTGATDQPDRWMPLPGVPHA